MGLSGEEVMGLQELYLSLTEIGFEGRDGWYEPESRGGVFGQALTIWLWMLQTMNGSSMASALGQMHDGACDLVLKCNRHGQRINAKEISTTTGGYARARQRLPEVDVEDVTATINKAVHASIDSSNDKRAYFIDGTLVTLARTKELATEYGCPKSKHGDRNHPLMRVVFATDAISGVAVNPSFGGYKRSEQQLSAAVLDALDEGSLVIADRNFGVFSVISHAVTGKKDILVRLSIQKAHKFLKGEPSHGLIDKPVIWEKSYRDTLLNAQDPESIKGRFIRFEINRAGFRDLTLYLFTTSSLPAEKLAELYGRRTDIETDIRHLKSLFAMEQLLVKSPEMVRKHLHILFAAHNLLRAVIANISTILKLSPRQISFKNAVMYILIYGEKIRLAKTDRDRSELFSNLLTAVRRSKLPNRKKRRSEPRMVTRRKSTYPLIFGSRADAKKRLNLL